MRQMDKTIDPAKEFLQLYTIYFILNIPHERISELPHFIKIVE